MSFSFFYKFQFRGLRNCNKINGSTIFFSTTSCDFFLSFVGTKKTKNGGFRLPTFFAVDNGPAVAVAATRKLPPVGDVNRSLRRETKVRMGSGASKSTTESPPNAIARKRTAKFGRWRITDAAAAAAFVGRHAYPSGGGY